MDAGPLIERILNDEGLTGDLPEAEAEAVNRWLIGYAEGLAKSRLSTAEASRRLELACRHVRGVGEVLAAWRAKGDPAAAAKKLGLAWKPGRTADDTFVGLISQFAFDYGEK